MIVQEVVTSSTAVATGTTAIPQDDTIPQNTEGTQFMTLAITPTSATNKLIIETTAFLSHSAVTNITMALFQDSTADALAAIGETSDTAGGSYSVRLIHSMTAGTTSSTTFKMRAGGETGSTITFNGKASARLYGAINKSSMKITEIVV